MADVSEAARILQLTLPHEFVGDRDLVESLAAVPQRQGGGVNQGVAVLEEVLGMEEGRDARDRFLVHHEGGEHSRFRFGIVWRCLLVQNHVRPRWGGREDTPLLAGRLGPVGVVGRLLGLALGCGLSRIRRFLRLDRFHGLGDCQFSRAVFGLDRDGHVREDVAGEPYAQLLRAQGADHLGQQHLAVLNVGAGLFVQLAGDVCRRD